MFPGTLTNGFGEYELVTLDAVIVPSRVENCPIRTLLFLIVKEPSMEILTSEKKAVASVKLILPEVTLTIND